MPGLGHLPVDTMVLTIGASPRPGQVAQSGEPSSSGSNGHHHPGPAGGYQSSWFRLTALLTLKTLVHRRRLRRGTATVLRRTLPAAGARHLLIFICVDG